MGVAEEGPIGPHKAKAVFEVPYEVAGLGLEDGGVDTAPVEAEEAGKVCGV